jgi:hypothetical protein
MYDSPNVEHSGETDMNVFRISLTTSTGHHIEDKPFKTREEAEAYAACEAASYGAIHTHVADLGEGVLMKVEVTDTYGGESNYSWVKRYEQWITKGVSDREAVRIAKKLAGWTGHPCATENYGGMSGFTLRPRNLCQILFINFDYDHVDA